MKIPTLKKKFEILFVLFCLQVSYVFCEKILINIDRIVRELDADAPDTTCDISLWANQLSNACKCCLFKRVPKIGSGPGQKTVEKIVNECISKNYCTQELINSFKGSAPDLKTALYQLYNTSVVIKTIDKEGITFDAAGTLTEQGVKTLLEKAYKEGKLPYEDFKSVTCIKVQDIFAQEKGRVTAQLFLINSECSEKPRSYILKGMPKYSEARHLAELFGFKELDDLIWPSRIEGYPSLAIPFAFFQYNNHYLSLAPRASGRELSKFIFDYISNPTQENKQNVEQAYFDIGYAISKFHQRFMKNKNDILGLTVIHGSFHYRNIFYDTTTHQVTLIDNAKISDSFKRPESPIVDIAYLLFLPSIKYEITSKVKFDSLLDLIAAPFLKGYVSAYPRKDWLIVFNQMVNEIKKYERKKINRYNKYRNVMDKQFEIVQQFIQNNQAKPEQGELESSLTKLKNSLSALAELLSIS